MNRQASDESPVRRDRLHALLEAARALPPEARTAHLRAAAGDDVQLLAEALARLEAPPTAESAASGGAISRFATLAAEAIPQRIGAYRILSLLGAGGMGVVYRAQHPDLKNAVAIKVAQPRPGSNPKEIVARFELERRSLAAMSHRCIARVFDAGTTEDGRPYFVMELVEGEPLTAFCDRRGLTVAQRLRLFQQLCEGVQHAHGKGVVHRDLKPDNVLVVEEGGTSIPKILDFGIAKAMHPEEFGAPSDVTEEFSHLGTLVYMSPEQVEGHSAAVDIRSDVYTLGVMLYEVLAGSLPYPRELLDRLQRQEGLQRVLQVLSTEEPEKPSVRASKASSTGATDAPRKPPTTGLRRLLAGDLDWIVLKAMAKEPERRYATAIALAEDLQRHLDDQPVSAGPPSARYRARKFARRNRHWIVALGAVAVLISLLVAQQWRSARRELAEAACTAGRLALQTGRWQEARDAFGDAIAHGHPDITAILCSQVECLEAQGRGLDAKTLLARIPPGATRALESRRLLLLGALGTDRLSDPRGGTRELREALALHDAALEAGEPGLGAGDLGYLRSMLALDLDEMVARTREAIDAEPFHFLANEQLPALLILVGDVEGSIEAGRALLARWPDDAAAASVLSFAKGLLADVESAGEREASADDPAPSDPFETTRAAMSFLREELEASIESGIRSIMPIPGKGRPASDRKRHAQSLVQTLATFSESESTAKLWEQLRRLPPAVLEDWEPVLTYARSFEFDDLLGLLVRPAQLLATLDSCPIRGDDAGLLLLRVSLRMNTPATDESLLADLDRAAKGRGPLGSLPELGRQVNTLRMLTLVKLNGPKDLEPVRREELHRRIASLAREQLGAPRLGVAEFWLYAKAALLVKERSLARDLLLRGVRDHIDDTGLMLFLGETAMRSKEYPLARRWLKSVLVLEPKNKGALSALARVEAEDPAPDSGK